MTPEQLTEIEARAAAATPGPWVNMGDDRDDGGPWFGELRTDYSFTLIAKMPELDDRTNDFEFIAHAREDVPALIAEIKRLQANIETRAAATDLFIRRFSHWIMRQEEAVKFSSGLEFGPEFEQLQAAREDVPALIAALRQVEANQ